MKILKDQLRKQIEHHDAEARRAIKERDKVLRSMRDALNLHERAQMATSVASGYVDKLRSLDAEIREQVDKRQAFTDALLLTEIEETRQQVAERETANR